MDSIGVWELAEEFEVKVLSVNLAVVREKLRGIGRLDRRVRIHDYIFENDFTKASGIVVRLRATGAECILTFKGPYEGALGRQSREEVELPIASLELGQSLLRLAGFTQVEWRSFDRDYYVVGSVSVEIIYTSLYPPYLEVEGAHDEVIKVCGQLGIEDSEIIVGGQAYVRPSRDE